MEFRRVLFRSLHQSRTQQAFIDGDPGGRADRLRARRRSPPRAGRRIPNASTKTLRSKRAVRGHRRLGKALPYAVARVERVARRRRADAAAPSSATTSAAPQSAPAPPGERVAQATPAPEATMLLHTLFRQSCD